MTGRWASAGSLLRPVNILRKFIMLTITKTVADPWNPRTSRPRTGVNGMRRLRYNIEGAVHFRGPAGARSAPGGRRLLTVCQLDSSLAVPKSQPCWGVLKNTVPWAMPQRFRSCWSREGPGP